MEPKSETRIEGYAADISSIREAQGRIKSFIRRTDVLTSKTLNALSGKHLFFKCECFLNGYIGSFKIRGACNAVFSLDDDQAAKGVVTQSSGNHGAALAFAAKMRGIPAYVAMPSIAPKCKFENVMRYDAQIIKCDPTLQSRETTASTIVQQTGAILIPSSNDPRIISGQGTMFLELLEQVPQLDTIIAPISGGGMIVGIDSLAAKSINPSIRVLAAGPSGANDAFQFEAAIKIIRLPETKTIADGLRAFLGNHTWPVLRDLVDDIILVEDDEIVEAMKLCYQVLKVAVAPSGAVALAVVLSKSFLNNPIWQNECNRIGIVFSGGNVDLGVLWESLRNLETRRFLPNTFLQVTSYTHLNY
ncbi:serine racemase-like [Rutidosis leptorrhynchoides]|uniref:serine racemase-like n=1 Tax=Rutidosis leptorrhynchoides TaxID=125765 RepID=UPI003A9961C8